MSVPPELLRELRDRFGGATVLEPVGGGCINPAVRLRLPMGDAFLKFNRSAPDGLFPVEADALRALGSATGVLHVPTVLAFGDGSADGDRIGYLLLEWLEPAPQDPIFGETLGHGLAEVHRTRGRWGWGSGGFIGPLPVDNEPLESWAAFWRDRRLRPQLEYAASLGWRIGRDAEWEMLFGSLDELLAPAEEDGPSLLHGDLWSGNVIAARVRGGVLPALVDPASYHGHREVDLAMAELFGGFPADFGPAYEEAWPLQPGYRDGRRAAYQLFYLLVHVNLFGAGYVKRTERALREALAAR